MHPLNETSDNDTADSTSNADAPRNHRDRSKGRGLALVVEPERLGICRLPPKNRVPIWVHRSSFFSVSRSRDELSIVCEEKLVPKSVRCEVGWRAIKVQGTLDPSLIGVLASLANPLTRAGVSIFSISTYDTDYLLVRHQKLSNAKEALEAAGHRFVEEDVAASVEAADDGVTPPESAAIPEPVAPPEPVPTEVVAKRRGSDGERRPRRDSLAGHMAAERAAEDRASEDRAPQKRAAKEELPEIADEEPPARRRPESRKRRIRGGRSKPPVTDASAAESAEAGTEARGDKVTKGSSPTPAASSEAVASTEAESPTKAVASTEAVPSEDLSPDATIVLRDGSTRRRSLRSQERRERLNQALRQFGAALTSDPRFRDPSPTSELAEGAAAKVPERNEDDVAKEGDVATKDRAATQDRAATKDRASSTVPAQAAPGTDTATASTDSTSDSATDELDLDWESDLKVAADGEPSSDRGTDGDADSDADSDGKKATPSGKPSDVVFEAATSGAFEGESLSFGNMEDDEDEDEALIAEGLATGAIPQSDVEVTDQSFATLGLSDEILDAIKELGFTHPTPIQAAVIPEALEGMDIIGLAETGSGKTAAFVLPLAERLYHGKGIRGLIICPTREIALQTKAFIDSFGKNHKLRAVAIIGGVKMGPQIDRLRAKPDIVVATPGRLADHLRRRNVDLNLVEELVIDEADHMLDLGFLPQIKEILEQVPTKRRSMMFSATMLPAIERLAQQFMNDPLMIDIRPVNQVAEGIEHRLYLVHDADLKTCLLGLLDEVQGSTLIFARRKLHTEWLARQLQQAGCPADRIHSDRTQAQRVRALRGFREGKFRILVATDVAARGIDVPRIQHVINYGLPESVEDYVHRAGRTARGNSVGVVSSIGTWQDKATVREIEAAIGVEMPRCSVEGVEAYTEMRPRRKTVRRRRLL